MKNESAAEAISRWIALGALFLIPFTPLVVANGYFFPFITGKAFYFRILVEVAASAWAALALLDRDYRPRFSWIGAVVVGFVAWMFVADSFALNVAKAFWSNFERMEGWVLLIHLLAFFFAASAVLRAEKKWRAWFLVSVAVSVIVSAYSLLQLGGVLAIHQGASRIDATLGNSAYLAVYFLFSAFIALWLALTEKRAWLKWLLVAIAASEGVLIFFTETRGTVLGLAIALALAALLTAVTAGKRARRLAASALAVIVIAAGGFYLARNSSFVQGNHVLQRIATISLADGATRFTIWRMALRGVAERPVIGWGQEGFNYVFNKYYDPSLYAQEPWFDRAHNAFLDWFTAGGAPAFILYLALFGTAIALLWRRSELSRAERTLFTAVLAGYAVHNLFVFDNIYSYVYFFAILAFIDSQTARPVSWLERAPVAGDADGMTYVLPAAAAVALVLVWTVNVPGMQVASGLITALSESSSDPSASIATFQELAAHPSFAAQEVREQIVSFAASLAQDSSATAEEKQQAVALAVSEMGKQVAAYPFDAREHLELSYVYRAAGDSAGALKEIGAALKLTPAKEQVWVEAGMAEVDANDAKAAQADFNKAYELGPQFQDLAAYAAAGDIIAGDSSAADAILQNAFGTTTVDNSVLAVAYYRTKSWQKLVSIWQLRVAAPGATAQTWFSLAAAYYAAGDTVGAIRTINAAVARYPEAAASGAAAIKQIQAGR